MNIWFFSAHEHPKSHTSRTYDFSQELIKRGHQVSIFTNSYCHRTHIERLSKNEKWRVENIDKIRVIWLKTIHYSGNGLRRGMNMISYAWRANQFVKTLIDNPDVIVGDSVPPVAGLIASYIASKTKAAFVYQIRDVWPIALVYDGGLSRISPVYYIFRIIEKYLYRKSQCICATMPYIHDHVFESGGNPEKIIWIPNGVNTDKYIGFSDYKGGDENIVAMYVGAFGNAHDVITIVRAAKILQEKGNKDYHFVLVGDGVKKKECENEANKFQLRNIEFRNSVEKKQVPQLQDKSDILIACVTDSEAYKFGINLNKLYDYFASGRPVIFSGLAPNDPVVDSGAGFSILPESPEKMVEVLEEYQAQPTEKRRELGKKARQYAEDNFDTKILVKRLEEAFLKIVKINKNKA